MIVIQTQHITKQYGNSLAVDHVSMHVEQGEIYGFLGLNGAGKTTMIRLLLGLIKPDHGSCLIFDKSPKQATALWNDVGYLIETPHAYPNLSVVENLQVIAKLRDIKDSSVIDRVITQLNLTPYKNKKEAHLSLGNKQRLGLAKALIHRLKLLILDEPINGLDPAGIVEIRELLLDLSQNHRTTIFLSSHILSEIAKLTDRIGIIHQGALIKEIESSKLDHQIIKKLQINTSNNQKALELLRDKNFQVNLSEGKLELSNQSAIEHPEEIATLLVAHQLPPNLLYVFKEDLEHYFLRVIEEYRT